MKILIVYFSLTGNTKGIANAAASEISADVEWINDSVKRTGLFGYLRTVREAMFKHIVPIQPSDHNPGQYDLVIIGTPVWAWSLSSPVRAYLVEHSSNFSRVAFFCTEGGAGGSGVFKEMARLCGKQPLATLEITESDIKSGADKEKLKSFIHSISQLVVEESSGPAGIDQ